MERDDLELELAAAAATVVAAPEAAAAAAVVAAPEASIAAAVVAAPEASAASGTPAGDDEEEGTLELLDEVVEKTKTMTMTDKQVTSSAAVPASLVVALAQTTRRPATKKKLLVLNLSGLLGDINYDFHNAHLSHGRCRGKLVFKRPFCDDFLKFCFRNFDVGVWSSRLRVNVDAAVDVLMKGFKHRLLFSWDASKCTSTGLNTLENKNKPLVLKELKKLWSKEEADGLPWQQGDFSPSNTLLVDNNPYKALLNPPHTAIFPCPYSYKNHKDDSSLGPSGDLRLYLESLATADDVPSFVREHPFGQPAITESDPNWNFYKKILVD